MVVENNEVKKSSISSNVKESDALIKDTAASFEKGNDSLGQLNGSELFDQCKRTAKTKPEISIQVLSTPELRNKLSDFLQGDIIKSNPRIGQALYELGIELLIQLGEKGLFWLCYATA